MKLVKVAAVLELRRPQNPEGAVKVPGVVLIGGSGSDGRDELVAGHRPFLVWADYLRRKGSAVLHYDKLGVRRLGGNYPAGVTSDFASDAEAAFSYMRARPVMLAGSGVPGDQLLVEQARLIVETNALSRKQADTPLIIDVFS